MATKEICKSIQIVKGYEVSNHGRVRSIDRYIVDSLGRKFFRRGKMLSPQTGPGGYKTVHLGAKFINRYIHHLVMNAFVGKTPEGLQILHNDDNKDNNFIENLRFGTYLDNYNDAVKNGLNINGTRNPRSKLNETDVKNIRNSLEPGYTLAWKYNVSPSTIRDIKLRHKWRWLK